ncbi:MULTISPECIES: L-threonylcarbamoyladenylate synthase [Geobacillus]|uniref:Threonylcarbamoyl-AMP synthase n=1 Tax=Geobacillus genomosp. 3 TaxID=1921421 RepID=S6A462_GEOG3|nr:MULTISPECIES: L-threonylcarbamoyladenylate synthase [Geobacillus]AGT33736.1 tRNA threonylcarbamoyladenosine biosynthesis protein [Geobacillus genomosp. 3]QIZ68937.1 threonylcarbamoyl-AMP synthase [Geobacillus subterraneus]WPZ20159.1 L-threonylcarbamoyladenylate synthase [Geobacillus subterraneus]
MKTRVWTVDNIVDKQQIYPQIQEAAEWLRAGEVVAFPTETVYGLGADAANTAAVGKIFAAKGRPSDNPLIVHVANVAQVEAIAAAIPPVAKTLMERFWPGPLTLVLPKRAGTVSERVTANLPTVAVRMPDHPLALALIEASGLALAAPSANRSGKPSPTTAAHVLADLNGRIAGVIDGGPTGIGVESTVLDCSGEVPTILRPGGVTKEALSEAVGRVEEAVGMGDEQTAPKAPGMKYTHYAPKAPLSIVSGPPSLLQQLVDESRAGGKTVGVLTTEENKSRYAADVVLACGTRRELETVAHRLYDTLRRFDETGVDLIYSEAFPEEGIGVAIMNRLKKAAGGRVIRE